MLESRFGAGEAGDDARGLVAPYDFDGAMEDRCGSVADTATDAHQISIHGCKCGSSVSGLGSCPFVFREKLLGYFCDDDLPVSYWRFISGFDPSGINLGRAEQIGPFMRFAHSPVNTGDYASR